MLSAETTETWGGWLDTLSQPSPTGPDTAETETACASYEIVRCDRLARGSTLVLADVLLTVGGIDIMLAGWTVTKARGVLCVSVPQHRHPVSGAWTVSVDLPPPLLQAIGMDILAAAGIEVDLAVAA